MAKQNIQSYKIIIIAKDVVCISFRQINYVGLRFVRIKGINTILQSKNMFQK